MTSSNRTFEIALVVMLLLISVIVANTLYQMIFPSPEKVFLKARHDVLYQEFDRFRSRLSRPFIKAMGWKNREVPSEEVAEAIKPFIFFRSDITASVNGVLSHKGNEIILQVQVLSQSANVATLSEVSLIKEGLFWKLNLTPPAVPDKLMLKENSSMRRTFRKIRFLLSGAGKEEVVEDPVSGEKTVPGTVLLSASKPETWEASGDVKMSSNSDSPGLTLRRGEASDPEIRQNIPIPQITKVSNLEFETHYIDTGPTDKINFYLTRIRGEKEERMLIDSKTFLELKDKAQVIVSGLKEKFEKAFPDLSSKDLAFISIVLTGDNQGRGSVKIDHLSLNFDNPSPDLPSDEFQIATFESRSSILNLSTVLSQRTSNANFEIAPRKLISIQNPEEGLEYECHFDLMQNKFYQGDSDQAAISFETLKSESAPSKCFSSIHAIDGSLSSKIQSKVVASQGLDLHLWTKISDDGWAAWTIPGNPDDLLVLESLNQLMDKAGVVPGVSSLDRWVEVFKATGEFPLLIQAVKGPSGDGLGYDLNYIAVTHRNRGISAEEAQLSALAIQNVQESSFFQMAPSQPENAQEEPAHQPV